MGNALQLPSCASCSSANNGMCSVTRSLGSIGGCGSRLAGGGGLPAAQVTVVHIVRERLMEVGDGATAAEVMLDHPNHLLVCGSGGAGSEASAPAAGKRWAPLSAHQELLPGRLYFLIPMNKLRTRLSAMEAAHLTHLIHRLMGRPPPEPLDHLILPPSAAVNHRAAPPPPPTTPPSSFGCSRLQAMIAAAAADHSSPDLSLLSSFLDRTPPPAHLWRLSLQTIDETPHLRSWTFREGLLI